MQACDLVVIENRGWVKDIDVTNAARGIRGYNVAINTTILIRLLDEGLRGYYRWDPTQSLYGLSIRTAYIVGLKLNDIRTRLRGALVCKFNGRDSAFNLLTIVGYKEPLCLLICN